MSLRAYVNVSSRNLPFRRARPPKFEAENFDLEPGDALVVDINGIECAQYVATYERRGELIWLRDPDIELE